MFQVVVWRAVILASSAALIWLGESVEKKRGCLICASVDFDSTVPSAGPSGT